MKRMTAIFLVSAILFTFFGCSSSPYATCREILDALLESEVGKPAGKIYYLEAKPTEDGYLSEATLDALYGDVQKDRLLDLASFVPFGENPCEFAIFHCRDRDTANDVSRALSLRLSAIKRTKNKPQDPRITQMLNSAIVTVIGNYVFLIISRDTETALKTVKSLVKR